MCLGNFYKVKFGLLGSSLYLCKVFGIECAYANISKSAYWAVDISMAMSLFMSNIPTITPDDEYSEAKECEYKGERYSVRDNGAILRHVREGKPARKYDNIWTFGKKDENTGYMIFCGVRVHIVVATAFYGEHDSTKLVVDHIDTNRCNNRSENLRWLTRLENALNNPATLKKITYLCGGDIQKFLNDPSCLRDTTGTNQDVMWMRTVSAEEARNAFEKIMSWAIKPIANTPSKGKMGDWIYAKDMVKPPMYGVNSNFMGSKPLRMDNTSMDSQEYFVTSNPLAVQIGWSPRTNPEFPCCPTEVSNDPLNDYLASLKVDGLFVVTNYGSSTIFEFTLHNDKLLVITKIPNGVKSFALADVEWNGSVFVHISHGTFFTEDGVRTAYTREQGLVWDGPESIDDYC